MYVGCNGATKWVLTFDARAEARRCASSRCSRRSSSSISYAKAMSPMTADQQIIRPYGDRRDDGVVQLSFTLPVPLSEKAKEAARSVLHEDGLHRREGRRRRARRRQLHLLHRLRAHRACALDYAEIDVPEVVIKKLGFDELNALIEEKIGRRVVVFGACTGTDTHTVGIDAILNMKGFAGDYGLERYPWFEAFNLGSQVPNEELIRRGAWRRAPTRSWSARWSPSATCTRTTRGSSSRRRRRPGVHGKRSLLLGGPRVDHKLALELGFDAGFGPGTKPSDVANYIVHQVLQADGQGRPRHALRRRAASEHRAMHRGCGWARHDAHYGGKLVDGARMLGAVRRRGHRAAASATTATRGCSARTTRWSSSRRSTPATTSRRRARSSRWATPAAQDALRGAQGDPRRAGRSPTRRPRCSTAGGRVPRARHLRDAEGQAAGSKTMSAPCRRW